MSTKIFPTVGRYNNSPPRATVMLDDVEDFMTSAATRKFAMRLLSAADEADRRYAKWKAARKAPAPGRSGK